MKVIVVMLTVVLAITTPVHGAADPPLPVPVTFNSTFSSNMVLQRDSKAAVYGMLGDPVDGLSSAAQSVEIKVSGGGADYSVPATVTADGWLAYLKPTSVSPSVFTITATCTGCKNTTATIIENVVFGDVWVRVVRLSPLA
jgi:hypothetical protein